MKHTSIPEDIRKPSWLECGEVWHPSEPISKPANSKAWNFTMIHRSAMEGCLIFGLCGLMSMHKLIGLEDLEETSHA